MKTITIVIIGIFLLAGVMALVLPYVSNVLTGTVSVSGPIFYMNGDGSLLINDDPDNFTEHDLTTNGGINFTSDELGINSFYSADYDIYVFAKAIISGDKLDINIFGIDSSNVETLICNDSINMTNTVKIVEKSLSCSSGALTLSTTDKFRVMVSGDGIMRNHNSGETEFARVEVSKT